MEDELEGVTHVRVTFHPQVWYNEYAIKPDDFEAVEFIVPLEDALDGDGNLVHDDCSESDKLQMHENAPEAVREWEGPFYITIGELLGPCGSRDHDFVYDENWRDEIELGDNSLIIPETCRICGAKAYENWVLDGAIKRPIENDVEYIYEA